MSSTSTEIAKPIKYLNSGPLDKNRGPYPTIAEANKAIKNIVVNGINFREGKFVEIGNSLEGFVTYWWNGGYSDSDLVEYFSVFNDFISSISDTYAKSGDSVALNGLVWTDKTYINSLGSVSSTTGNISSTNRIELPFGEIKYRYRGNLAGSGVSIAFYDTSLRVIKVITAPITTDPKNFIILAPPNAKSIRCSCANADIINFNLHLAEAVIISKPVSNVGDMMLNEIFAISLATYNAEGVMSQATIVWQDGSSGTLTMTDYNEDIMSFDGYTITHVSDRTRTLAQPKVTRNIDGDIIIIPLKILS
ncbi:hypothetical protein [Pedobacter antarcticus]|uniref:hypothetical protein n=1 Tax=Pedobacter antarcticus TaxID=34086 RepID=UPI0008900473|nr:hypothetical protein [Pedobacter antarcticus]SDM40907.1 hypothetical protein SAMN04488084_106181 [Pedobacter antarcticus]